MIQKYFNANSRNTVEKSDTKNNVNYTQLKQFLFRIKLTFFSM